MPNSEGGLGTSLVGEKIAVNHRQVIVSKLLGEGTQIDSFIGEKPLEMDL